MFCLRAYWALILWSRVPRCVRAASFTPYFTPYLSPKQSKPEGTSTGLFVGAFWWALQFVADQFVESSPGG